MYFFSYNKKNLNDPESLCVDPSSSGLISLIKLELLIIILVNFPAYSVEFSFQLSPRSDVFCMA